MTSLLYQHLLVSSYCFWCYLRVKPLPPEDCPTHSQTQCGCKKAPRPRRAVSLQGRPHGRNNPCCPWSMTWRHALPGHLAGGVLPRAWPGCTVLGRATCGAYLGFFLPCGQLSFLGMLLGPSGRARAKLHVQWVQRPPEIWVILQLWGKRLQSWGLPPSWSLWFEIFLTGKEFFQRSQV